MSGMNKAERLAEMKRLYIQRSYSDIEMAKRLGVTRETVFRDRIELTSEYPIEKDNDGRYHIPRTKLISEIKVNLHEALSLYLAARRTSRQTRFHHPHAANAMEKLAATLRQPMTEKLLRAANEVLKQEKDPERIKIIETLTQAWVEQRKVRIEYQPLGMDGFTRHTISIYLIEPSIWSDSVYAIALSDFNDKIVPFKIERIRTAFLSGETFEIPANFDEQALLKHAWGIWYGDKEPITVKLRFKKEAARRLLESKWHPLEDIHPTGDGGCIWSVEVAEWREMLPWVRGWGAEVEVLEPKELRNALARESKSLAELYQVVEMKRQFIAHIRKKDKEPQYLTEHLDEVSYFAGQFASKIGLKQIGEILGLLHDLGKASEKFQKYILSGEGFINPDAEEYIDPIANKGKIDHTTAGAQVIYEKLLSKGEAGRITAQALALCIASHHSGLIDCLSPDGVNDFQKRIEKSDENTRRMESLSNSQEIIKKLDDLLSNQIEQQLFAKISNLFESTASEKHSGQTREFTKGLLLRFLLSCLLDADRLSTADFENSDNKRTRNYGKYYPWEMLVQRLNAKIEEFGKKHQKNSVDMLRNQVSQACLDFSTKPKGIYALTVPTGGGKTFASLRFALNHAAYHTAQENKVDRIFYIIPYTSIIDQNADEVRAVLEDRDENGKLLDKVVLEHHSNLTPEEETRRQNLLAQNWDAPIVFTTQVQFLEALFGSGTRSARRMHQLANSVIIFDEVQTMPIKCLQMFNVAIRFLVHNCGASVVLCTATQPPLAKVGSVYRALSVGAEQHIIQNEPELFRNLKRVEVSDERQIGGRSDEEIANMAEKELKLKGSVLIIVNTKKSARTLYEIIVKKNIAKVYHLSTNMCPFHRLKVLDEIKAKLKEENPEPLICVSTQLIEAGVDVDFGSVIRYLAGLDSIAQAAGRCNRNGRQKDKDGNPILGRVLIVNPETENIESLEDIKIGIDQAKAILDQYKVKPESFENDRIGLTAIGKYYERYFYNQPKGKMEYPVDSKSLVRRQDNLFNLLSINSQSTQVYEDKGDASLDLPFKQSFLTAAKSFEVIDLQTHGVIVPYGKEGREIIDELRRTDEIEKQYKWLKKAQKYSVNLYHDKFKKLREERIIQRVQEDLEKGPEIYYMLDKYYDEEQLGWLEDPFLAV